VCALLVCVVQYPLYSLQVFDEFENGHPAALGFFEREETEDLVEYLQVVKKTAQEHCPGWMPSCFMTNCADNERAAIAEVFPGVPIYLCIYHVRKAWTKKLLEVVKTHEKRAAMNAALHDLCFGSTLTNDDGEHYMERCARRKLRAFYDRFCMEVEYIQYFKKEWEPCMGKFKLEHLLENVEIAV
jgi:hypothetical protein